MSDGWSGMALTDWGAHAAQQGDEERFALYQRLLGGAEDISTYTTGVCYDTVGFCLFLQGRVSIQQLAGTIGQDWVSVLGLESGYLWQAGDSIPPGSAVGFTRVGDYQPGFFHAALSTGGTTVRGVNGMYLGPGWSVEVDFAQALQATDVNGVYLYDGQPIEVRYV
jgi:hypothetical protein